jgi:Ca2+-binding RTX toxin-like protein
VWAGRIGLLALVALAAPSSASAAPSGAPLVIEDNTGGGEIRAAVGGDLDHHIVVTFRDGAYLVSDTKGVQSLQPSCTPVDAQSVSCARTGGTGVEIRTGAGNDVVVFQSMFGNDVGEAITADGDDAMIGSRNHAGNQLRGQAGDDLIFGRDGNDALYGGPGADKLVGGPGKDYFGGGSGNDRLRAADGERDSRLICDGGNDRASFDRIDPMPVSC